MNIRLLPLIFFTVFCSASSAEPLTAEAVKNWYLSEYAPIYRNTADRDVRDSAALYVDTLPISR